MSEHFHDSLKRGSLISEIVFLGSAVDEGAPSIGTREAEKGTGTVWMI